MGKMEDLEKLADLKAQGVISEQEFEDQKKAILESNLGESGAVNASPKSGNVYVILAFFFGLLGIHNYYIGRWKRATIQLLLTIGGPLLMVLGVLLEFPTVVVAGVPWLLFGLFFNSIWVAVNIFAMKTDGKGRMLKADSVLRIILGVITLLFSLSMLTLCSIGGLAGYSMAMNRHKANMELDYVARCGVMALGQSSDGAIIAQSCEELLPGEKIDGNEYEIEDGIGVFTIETPDFPTGMRRALTEHSSEFIQIVEDDDGVKFIFQK